MAFRQLNHYIQNQAFQRTTRSQNADPILPELSNYYSQELISRESFQVLYFLK